MEDYYGPPSGYDDYESDAYAEYMREQEERRRSRRSALRRLRWLEKRVGTHIHEVGWREELLDRDFDRFKDVEVYDEEEFEKLRRGMPARPLEGCVPKPGERFFAKKGEEVREITLPPHTICIIADLFGMNLVELVIHEFTEHLKKDADMAYLEAPITYVTLIDQFTRRVLENPNTPQDLRFLALNVRKICDTATMSIENKGYWAGEEFVDRTVPLLIRKTIVTEEERWDRACEVFEEIYGMKPSLPSGSHYSEEEIKKQMKKLSKRDRELLESLIEHIIEASYDPEDLYGKYGE